MKSITIIILSFFIYQFNYACQCFGPDLSEKSLLHFDGIYHVKVDSVFLADENKYPEFAEDDHFMKVSIIHTYKGSKIDTVKVFGGNRKFGRWTSCDIGINEGEEWILFLRQDEYGFLYQNACSYEFKYRNDQGVVDRAHHNIFKFEFLNNHYGRNIHIDSTSYFDNGQLEFKKTFKDENLHGRSTFYYPDGQRHGFIEYKNGEKHGLERWWTSKGYPLLDRHYHKGHKDSMHIYFSRADTHHIYKIEHYNDTGRINYSKTFRDFGIVKREEGYFDSTYYYVSRYYFRDGKLSDEMINTPNDFGEVLGNGHTKQWDENGNIISEHFYLNGKFIE